MQSLRWQKLYICYCQHEHCSNSVIEIRSSITQLSLTALPYLGVTKLSHCVLYFDFTASASTGTFAFNMHTNPGISKCTAYTAVPFCLPISSPRTVNSWWFSFVSARRRYTKIYSTERKTDFAVQNLLVVDKLQTRYWPIGLPIPQRWCTSRIHSWFSSTSVNSSTEIK